ncbi:DNA polymerase III subunit alpha [Myroides marinus]|uniref:DNA-directed DNA polymerase n=1 Tax=Myroides marinus TaxID=703342 RepID=A0A163X5Q9_9FLAO|nr:DNA polymerase III subunit alpha [Myroides marinus]KZE77347.1 DNA polymerase III subunit alpha [Myroides marinus]
MLLNCHSYFSLRYGTIPVQRLVQLGQEHNISAMALTDINNLSGVYEFITACQKVEIKPIIGTEIRDDNQLRYILIAKNQEGFGEIGRFLTELNEGKTPLSATVPEFKDCYIIYPFASAPTHLKEDEYIGIRSEQLTLLYTEKWKSLMDKIVILHTINHLNEEDYNLHCILRAIDNNTLLSKLTDRDCAAPTDIFKTEEQLAAEFRDYPIIIENSKELINSCNYSFTFKVPRNKKHYTECKQTDSDLLEQLAYTGMINIYGKDHVKAQERLAKELKVINELNFAGYFLITWDIIQYSNSQGYMHIGRGSGANSIVGYCLGITNVCPLELDLYFERFLNQNRKSPPDFDIDWSWNQRDDILRYIFSKYGKEHVAFCGAVSTFKYRSIIREIGKVYGLSKSELDALTRNPIEDHETNSIVLLIHQYGQMLEGFPNQRTMHACGILISEEPITNFTALDLPPKGFPVVQFDMHTAEDIGFDKFDILSQRGIGHINEAAELILQNQGIEVDIRNIALSKDEELCNQQLKTGNTIGCFYIESPAMRGLLRRLQCDNYKILVAASSIIRPGVAQSGMMQEYIYRHNHPNEFEYFHPVFEEQLGETYGIMVYQEDVIKIALHYGGLPATDGDILRRAMSGKSRSLEGLQAVKNRFYEHCDAKGHPRALSEEIYRQIESFAGYSFCKAHSASYAIESYQSLYLKTYYPLEFITAVINNEGGFYRTEVYIHEAAMSGANVLPPCVNSSDLQTTLIGKDLYLGLKLIEGISLELLKAVLKERKANGRYESLFDFIQRVPIAMESLQKLIFIGAFQSLGKQKNELLIQAKLLLTKKEPAPTLTLLQEPIQEYTFPTLKRFVHEDAFDELELLGFPISCMPFELLKTKFRGDVMVCDLLQNHKKTVRMLGYLIARKHVPTSKGSMYFGTWIDANGHYFDTVHFPDSLTEYPFVGGGCYLLLGTVEVEYHFPNVQILKMARLPFITDPRYHYDDDNNQTTASKVREDVSLTHRQPYPKASEINLPRHRMKFTK